MIEKEIMEKIIAEAIKELDDIMNVSPKAAVKDFVKKSMGRSVRTKDPLFWPAGMLMLGLVTAADGDTDEKTTQDILSVISKHVDLWKNGGGKIKHVDDALAGYALIKLCEKYGTEGRIDYGKYRELIDKIYEFLIKAPKDSEGTIIYNPSKGNTNIFADGVGQVTMFLAAYVRLLLKEQEESKETQGSTARIDTCIDILEMQLTNFHKNGADTRSGLVYHGYRYVSAEEYGIYKQGLLGWGRACGWFLMGLAEAAVLFDRLDLNQEIVRWYRTSVDALLGYQRPDGGFSWQIQAVDGHVDMSATGMLAYSIAIGSKYGILDKLLGARLEMARDSMILHTLDGVVMDALSSCDDFAVHYQTYGSYPWGQGAVLAALAEI